MKHRYKKSSCTLICLGASGHIHAPMVKALVADVDYMIQNVFGRADFDWGSNSFTVSFLSHSGWESFGVLLQQPWFSQGWVVQEAALGPEALVLWAETMIDWLKIVRAYIWRIRRALKHPNIQHLWLSDPHLQGFHVRRNAEAITFRPEGATNPFTFLEILDCARWLGFTDPRDRIYASLGMPNSDKLLLLCGPIMSYHISRFAAISPVNT